MIKDFRKNVRLPEDVMWLMPGLQVKRWFALIFLGAVLMTLGVLILFDIKPVFYTMEFIRKVAMNLSTEWLAFAFVMVGAGVFFKGWQKTNLSMIDGGSNHSLLENLYRRRKLNRGPKIVAVGGGTGLSMLLRGIKNITNNVTAVVTVGDDGGSSGRLREEMGVLPPGDIRNCIAALADDEDLVTKLFQYRFKTGEGLEGHSFGNLFLTALCSITGDMYRAVKESSRDAELIILGPGSLYTSVTPNLLIKEIAHEIAVSKAKKIYVCNIMTQPGETDGYSVSDHINALVTHAGSKKIIDAVLVNDFMPSNLAQKYQLSGSYPVKIDVENIRKMGFSIFSRKLIEDSKEGLVRHSSNRVARAIYYWFRKKQKGEKIKPSAKLAEKQGCAV